MSVYLHWKEKSLVVKERKLNESYSIYEREMDRISEIVMS